MGCCVGNKPQTSQKDLVHQSHSHQNLDTDHPKPSMSFEPVPTPRPSANSFSIKEECKSLKINPSLFIQLKDAKVETDYETLQKLGEGHFGYVRLCRHRKTGQYRAVKSIEKAKLSKSFSPVFFREFEFLKSLDHPNILKPYECFQDASYIHIITEYVAGGQLLDYILKKKVLTESLAASIMKQVLSGVAYCHSFDIVHKDLQPENILLEAGGSETIKICDFVQSSLFTSSETEFKYKNASFCAPEILLGKTADSSCDAWSCGVLIFLLLSGKLPFYGRNDKEIKTRVINGEFSLKSEEFSQVSDHAKDLIRKLLQLDPKKRLSAQDALAHQWFQQSESHTSVDLVCLKNLSNFRFGQKFQQAISMFVSSHLVSKEMVSKMNKEFRAIDKNGDGKISREELRVAYEKVMSADRAKMEVDKIMANIDCNESGFIDYSEFIVACFQAEEIANKENLETAFRVFDQDGSGKLTVEEIRKLLGAGVSEERAVEMLLKEIDSNGDGEVDLAEFTGIMAKHFQSV